MDQQRQLIEQLNAYMVDEEEETKAIIQKTVELVSTKKLSVDSLAKKLEREIDKLV
ncbi:hypothetical protein [Bacillus sp. CGMCC 1.16541]|uniref:hypothetical protein n=1 Tax=Bacillus sp. CGMCC 1.16541 TaxID=2185143 RepID=UPI0013A5A45D|nr:hypothetical protein [Bacillus sp. CGMCC 1.16541]